MKDGYLQEVGGAPTERELAVINKLSRRKLSADEIFVFSVVLCDNEIDRDFERFTIDALHTLAKLYVGKTGIFDHSMRGRDQLARVFECEVEAVDGKLTGAGEPYHRLKARAYMPKTAKNEDLILEIDAGIKKEVSVGCATAKKTCSICGADLVRSACGHVKGRQYRKDGKQSICHAVLDEPTDAYEWSFVAVPAQPQAGVVKGFLPREKEGQTVEIEEIVKSYDGAGELVLTAEQAGALQKRLEKLHAYAEAGHCYVRDLQEQVVKLFALAQPELSRETVEGVVSRMSVDELKAFRTAYEKAAGRIAPAKPQLCPDKGAQSEPDRNYLI